jgi:hypothetical protein
MFPQTAVVFQDNEIVPFSNPNDIGNRALYLLICSKVDEYFHWSVKQFEGFGDKALASIKIQCANISAEDTHHYHHMFTSLHIKDNESATNFFCRFTYTCTEAEAAGNSYTNEQLVSCALAGLNSTHNAKYDTALQLYRLEQETGSKTFTLEQLEKKFFTMDEQAARDNALTKIELSNAAQSHRLHNDKTRTHPKNQRKSYHRAEVNYLKRTTKNVIKLLSPVTIVVNLDTWLPIVRNPSGNIQRKRQWQIQHQRQKMKLHAWHEG